MLAWIKAGSGGGGFAGGWERVVKVLTNDRVVYSRGSLWRVLLQHTTPWGQLIHWPLTNQWTSNKILDQVRPSGKLQTYAFPNSKLTLTSHLGQNILVRGGVGCKLPKHLSWSVSVFFNSLYCPSQEPPSIRWKDRVHLSLEQMRLWIINMSYHYTKYDGSALKVTKIYIGPKCDHYLAV